MPEPCMVLDWAASGAMALTGQADGPPVPSPAPVLAMLSTVTDEFARVTRDAGTMVSADPAELVTVRAAQAGFNRRGQISAGGSSYLLRAADGWCAVTLSRRDDLAAVPAILGVLGMHGAELTAEPPVALGAAALARPAGELAAAAQLLGVPAAALPAATMPMTGSWPPWRTGCIAPSSASARLAGAVVADLSSMWAGPLCARLLGLAGADVIKVESPDRPDGARAGNREFFDWLHAGHRSLTADFRTEPGRAALKALHPDIPGHWLRELLGMRDGDVYLSPAPLYHAAPLAWSMSCHRSGATVVVMERFDAEQALALIERYRVTHSQWVPTMFVRLLKLPPEVRSRYDVSSLRWAVHAAAPCPVPVKRAMIDWWGPILFEFYSMTEGFGAASIFSDDWLRKPGSVGRPLMGVPHIAGPDGTELPAGEIGTIWFEGGSPSEYHGDPGKTAAAANERGWRTVGDVGYLDGDGYLYLTDRAGNLIISGGVNIYPQEIENVLTLHPSVTDAAVLGVPDPEMGEQVKAVIQVPGSAAVAGGELTDLLDAYCREHLAGFKCPRSFEFTTEELRTPVGKIRRGPLIERFGRVPGPYRPRQRG